MFREIPSLEFQRVFVRISNAIDFVMLRFSSFIVFIIVFQWFRCVGGVITNSLIMLYMVLFLFLIFMFQRVFVCIKFDDLQVVDVACFYNVLLWFRRVGGVTKQDFDDCMCGFNVVSWYHNCKLSHGLRTHFACIKFCDVNVFDFVYFDYCLFNEFDVL